MRMYFLLNMYLSQIQRGIQSAHCALEYAEKYWDTPEYREFVTQHKTMILLNGGASFVESEIYPFEINSLNWDIHRLAENGIPFATFREPFIGNAVTAVCFLCSRKVYDKLAYPDFQEDESLDGDEMEESYDDWVSGVMGGDMKSVVLRGIISGKSLA